MDGIPRTEYFHRILGRRIFVLSTNARIDSIDLSRRLSVYILTNLAGLRKFVDTCDRAIVWPDPKRPTAQQSIGQTEDACVRVINYLCGDVRTRTQCGAIISSPPVRHPPFSKRKIMCVNSNLLLPSMQ